MCYTARMDQASDNFDPEKSLVYLSQKTFVFDGSDRFLVLRRSATAPTRPLKWDLPGGAYEKGEEPEEAAQREIFEETGLTVTNIAPIGLAGEYKDRDRYIMTIAYQAIAKNTDVTLSFEHQEYRWVTKEEFFEMDSSDKWKYITRTYLK